MTFNPNDSLAWAGRFINKDKKALAEAIDFFGPDVQRLVRRILSGTGSAEDVEECVSDVFMAAWTGISRYEPERASFRTWLFLLAKYKALDLRRKLLRRGGTGEADASRAARNEISAEQEVLSRETASELFGCMQQMGEPDRSLFLRRYFLYESLDQLAQTFSLSKKAVESRLYRCRTLLKQKLGLSESQGKEAQHGQRHEN
ncbi:sigma-70 family RNA polymerase sigma factor [Paenibacillus sp. FSL M7-1046]|uniref:sigma-70 family RNA polymerase sigma factor n=1 Tax=Paenibacillus sp. FSL M7-1046 TaxID=2975315 RepID=UPI0030F88318